MKVACWKSFLCNLTCASACLAAPSAMNYQGRLLDPAGNPVNGMVQVEIALFSEVEGGTALYEETVGPVAVQNGVYSFHFGTNAAALRTALSNEQCWIEVRIEGAPLTPRQPLLSVPYALISATTEGSWQWDAAYEWGNHATNGYLTAEEDPLALAALTSHANNASAHGIATQIWNTAQYPSALLVDGTRALAGNLNMGGHGITNLAAASVYFTSGETLDQRFLNADGDIMTGKLHLPPGGLEVGNSQFVVLTNGNVGIGTLNATNTLAVNGSIRAREIIVELTGWSDHVFEPDYRLKPLSEVEDYIVRNKHLPGIPSEQEVLKSGIEVGQMQALLVGKLEELTLYVIELEKQNRILREALEELRAKIK